MYQIILFDLDDTLLDFASSEQESLRRLNDEFYQIADQELFSQTFKTINAGLWARLHDTNNPITPSEIKAIRFKELNQQLVCKYSDGIVSNKYELLLGETAQWIDGVNLAVEFLYSMGYILGVVTNGLVGAQYAKYHRHNLREWFECFIVSEEVGIVKPDRQIFNLAIEQIALKHCASRSNHNSILVVGDSLASDGLGAHNIGADFCFINRQLDFINHDFPPIKFHLDSVRLLPYELGHEKEYDTFLANHMIK